LRLDFTHFEGLGSEQIRAVEDIVNRVIDEFLPVKTSEMTLDEAKASGAAALFDEKYADIVRVVEVDGFSSELCGGTHVRNTGEIGGFKVVSESSVGSGLRRIEAITGTNLLVPYIRIESVFKKLSERFKASDPEALLEKISALYEAMQETKRELEAEKQAKAGDKVAELLSSAQNTGSVRLVTGVFDDMDIDGLRSLSDGLKAASGALVNVLVSKAEGKVTIVASVTDDLLEKGFHAGKLVKELAAAGGGGGGGKADMAQAGTKDPAKIPAILEAAERYISENAD
jgi:alanyl-tRNA synthetase